MSWARSLSSDSMANVVVDGICRRRPMETGTRPLCVTMIVLDAAGLIPVVKTIVDASRHKVDGLAGIVFLPGLLIFGAMLWLIYIYWSRLRPGPPRR